MAAALTVVALFATPSLTRAADEDVGVESGPKLKLYGFGDVNFTLPKVFTPKSTPPPHGSAKGSMYVGNLNLYLDAQISSRIRSLSEIRFTYLPNGSSQKTTESDYATGTDVSWGSISIERAWVEYAFSDLFTLQAGEFLTPYGIWNVDHGSPALLGNSAPTVIGTQLFPRQQVGIQAYGSTYLGDTRLGYNLTVSNGRMGDNAQYKNRNGKAAVGGRLYAESDAIGSLRVGVSGYAGRYQGYTNTTVSTVDPATNVVSAVTTEALSSQYEERCFGADVSWKWKHVGVNAELLLKQMDFRGVQTYVNGVYGGAQDHTVGGGYATLSYDLPWLGITPWIMLDTYKPNTREQLTLHNLAPGVDVRLRPDFVIKAQLDHVYSAGGAVKSSNDFAAQVAYAF